MAQSKAKKLTEKELKEVKDLQGEINNLLINIGNAELVKSQLIGKHVEQQEAWKLITSNLEKKYGSVNISLEDGTLSEIEEPTEEAVLEKA
jgi:hypothetical protein